MKLLPLSDSVTTVCIYLASCKSCVDKLELGEYNINAKFSQFILQFACITTPVYRWRIDEVGTRERAYIDGRFDSFM